jgi:hypothetical protein
LYGSMSIKCSYSANRGVAKAMTRYFGHISVILILLLGIGAIIGSGSNQPPTIESLTSDQSSPQKTGAITTWTAKATDPEGDEISYRFLFKGPRTQGKEEVMKDWSKSGIWTWEAKEEDIGLSDIIVQVRDESHKDVANGPNLSEKFEISGKQQAFLDVQVENEVYSPSDPRIYYCDEGGHRSIQNRIYLIGSNLDQVVKVKYILDPSFSPNEIVSDDASSNFEILEMAWGRFQMSALVTTRNGQEFSIPFAFQFKSKVLDAQSKGIPMIRKC